MNFIMPIEEIERMKFFNSLVNIKFVVETTIFYPV